MKDAGSGLMDRILIRYFDGRENAPQKDRDDYVFLQKFLVWTGNFPIAQKHIGQMRVKRPGHDI